MLRAQTITSVDDQRIADFVGIKDVARRRAGTFVAESELVIDRLLESPHPIRAVLLAPNRLRRLEDRLEARIGAAPVFVAEQEILDEIVGFPLHRGGIAIAERLPLPDPVSLLATARRVVVLEDVVDPDNVGSVFRHAAAFGADVVLLSANAGDPLYRKAVRTSMGWVLTTPYTRAGSREELVPLLHDAGLLTLAMTPAHDAVDLREIAPSLAHRRIAVLLGAEAPGLTDDTLARANHRVRIPIGERVDSLNVATAAAIAMYELFR